MHKISHLIDLWEKKFEQWVADGKRSPTSLDNYRGAIKNHIRPALGELRIGEATTQRIDTVISKITERAGAPRAKTCRAILSGMMKLAVRYGAISVNPVREIETIEAETKNPPRSLGQAGLVRQQEVLLELVPLFAGCRAHFTEWAQGPATLDEELVCCDHLFGHTAV